MNQPPLMKIQKTAASLRQQVLEGLRNAIISGGTEPKSTEISGKHSIFTHFLLDIFETNEEPYITSRQLFDKLLGKMT